MSQKLLDPLPGERPSATADRLISAARELIAWGREGHPDELRQCACGKAIHTTHIGAAQHAVRLMLADGLDAPEGVNAQPGQRGTLRLKIYQCRQNPRALHVGR